MDFGPFCFLYIYGIIGIHWSITMFKKLILAIIHQVQSLFLIQQHSSKKTNIAEHHLYEGPPQPCTVFQTVYNGRFCIAFRSLVTGKDHVFPPHYHTYDVEQLFRAYGYANAQETLNSGIKFVAL